MSRIFFKKEGQKPSVFATLGLISAGLAFLAFLAAGPAFRLGIFGDTSTDPTLFDFQFKLIMVALRLVAVAAGFTLAGIVHGRFSSRARTSWRAFFAAIAIAAMGWPLGSLFYKAENAPLLHDVSTAPTDHIPFKVLSGRRYDAASPSDIAGGRLDENYLARHQQAYPGLGSVPIPGTITEATQTALNVADSMGWQIVAQDTAAGHIEAIYESPWFGFRSMIVIRVREKDAVAFLDIRSVSEMGHTDFGINAKLIGAYTSALRKRLN